MKKLLSSILVLVVLLSMLSAAFAVPFTMEGAGVTIDVPEGMTVADASNENGYLLNITVDDNASLQYACLFSYSEELAGRQFEELTEEEAGELIENLAAGMVEPTYSLVERDGLPILVMENEDTTMFHLVALFDNWACDVAAAKHDGVALTEDEINLAIGMLMSIQFGDEIKE